MDYTHCYEVLGLSPDADWTEAQRQYRRLSSRLHPDRPGHETGAYTLADTNNAYHALKKYYRHHQRLPLARKPRARLKPTPFHLHGGKPRRRWRLGVFMGVSALCLYGYYHWQGAPQRPTVKQVAPAPDLTASTQSTRYIRPGDTLGRVAEIMGPPDRNTGRRWHYGDAWIEFRHGQVVDWHSSVNSPLPMDASEVTRSDAP